MKLSIILVTLVLLPLVILYNAFSWGFVSYKLYYWFIISLSTSMPILTINQFIGIAFFLSAIMPRHISMPIKREYEDKQTLWFLTIFAPWLTLLFSWFISFFI